MAGTDRRRLLGAAAALVALPLGLPLGLLRGAPSMTAEAAEPLPPGVARMALVPFEHSPFPYDGPVPGKGTPFLDGEHNGQRGHLSPRGGFLSLEDTYSDRRALIAIPRGFDPNRRAAIVLFLHGNKATLARDVIARQQVARQVAESGLNAVLVAPQFAVDALDSSAGRFWEPGFADLFLREAADRAGQLGGPAVRKALAGAPVILVAYSGGYFPAASALALGRIDGRVAGLITLDALYGEIDVFAGFLTSHRAAFLVAAYGTSSIGGTHELTERLNHAGIRPLGSLPRRVEPGTIAMIHAGDAVHNDFVTRAFAPDPLKLILSRVTGFSRR